MFPAGLLEELLSQKLKSSQSLATNLGPVTTMRGRLGNTRQQLGQARVRVLFGESRSQGARGDLEVHAALWQPRWKSHPGRLSAGPSESHPAGCWMNVCPVPRFPGMCPRTMVKGASDTLFTHLKPGNLPFRTSSKPFIPLLSGVTRVCGGTRVCGSK